MKGKKKKKFLKTFEVKTQCISNFYKEDHKSFTIIKTIPIKRITYRYIYYLNDGRLALNYSNELNIYSTDLETIEQTIDSDSIFITQLKDNSLINSKYNEANIYMYDEETKKFNFYYSLECINNAGKVMELTNDRLAFLSIGVCISIYIKENGKDVKDGKSFSITTIDDFIPINDNEIASILAQESEITFWDLTKREKISQIGKISNYGHSCLLLFGKSLIVGGANRNSNVNNIYIVQTDNRELIKKYAFFQNIWFMTKLNEKEFITGETKGIFCRYRFEENEVKLMEKNKDHDESEIVEGLSFCSINNQIASFSDTNCIIFKIDD